MFPSKSINYMYIMWVEFVVGSHFTPGDFSLSTLVSSLHKSQHVQFTF